jgi:hypothetical protein
LTGKNTSPIIKKLILIFDIQKSKSDSRRLMNASACCKKPLSVQRKGDMSVTQAELAKGLVTRPRVLIFMGPLGSWQIELTAQEKVLAIETQRGHPKTWRVLDDAIAFACDYCNDAQEVRIRFRDREFVAENIG